ncbi:MAG: hypothetical protein HW384_2154 [Dehalococcoidia bacterium]|nr:hypothetical protein [Dehalococcoidia bacterium]
MSLTFRNGYYVGNSAPPVDQDICFVIKKTAGYPSACWREESGPARNLARGTQDAPQLAGGYVTLSDASDSDVLLGGAVANPDTSGREGHNTEMFDGQAITNI